MLQRPGWYEATFNLRWLKMKHFPCCERLSRLLVVVFHHWRCSRVCHRYSIFCSLYTPYHYTPSTQPALSDGCAPQNVCRGQNEAPLTNTPGWCLLRLGNRIVVTAGTLPLYLQASLLRCSDLFVCHSPIRETLQAQEVWKAISVVFIGHFIFSFLAHNPFSVPRSQLWNLCFLMYACAVN